MDWQQIETAPTDGTAVLVTNGRGVWIAKHKAIFQYGYNPDSPWFCLMLNKDHIPGKFRAGKPTHWMPLPEAPNAELAVTRVVWVSGGKDSTAMALRLAELHPDVPWRYVCTPTRNELPDVHDHWERLGELLGRPLERVEHPLGLHGLVDAQQMLPSHAARWCTRMLKIQPALAFYAKHAPCVAYVGLRADEPERRGLFGDKVPQAYPLREWGWGLAEVKDYLHRRSVTVPKRTDCAWCYDQSLPDWWELWHRYPAVWAQGEEVEAKHGHTFRSPARDTWPVRLVDLRQRFERGDVPRNTELNRDLFDEEPTRCRACLL